MCVCVKEDNGLNGYILKFLSSKPVKPFRRESAIKTKDCP